MKKQNYEQLQKYEKQLHSAYIANFARLNREQLNDIVSIYENEYKETVPTSHKNCSHCVLKIVKRLANDYFNKK